MAYKSRLNFVNAVQGVQWNQFFWCQLKPSSVSGQIINSYWQTVAPFNSRLLHTFLEVCKTGNFTNLWIWLQVFKFIDYKYY